MSIPWEQVAVATVGAAFAAGILYLVIRAALARRRPRPSVLVSLAEYALVGWVLMYVFVTQVLAFGTSMGLRFNLLPLGALYDAWNFGLVNAGTLPQLGLNILITVPLGILLPLVFPKRLAGFLPLGLIGFGISLLTEVVQLVTGRSADIDDVITNTLGVLVGYSLLCLVRATRLPRARVVAAALVVLVAVAPFVAVWAQDARDPAGHLYYGHLRPANVETAVALSDDTATSAVYRYVQHESPAEQLARLSQVTGFTDCDYVPNASASGACTGGSNERLFVFPYEKWSVYYAYGEASGDVDAALIPDEGASTDIAEQALQRLGVDTAQLVYSGLWDWHDGLRHVVFSAGPSSGSTIVWGNIRVDIGEGGTVLGVEDYQATFEWVADVDTISSRAALQLAQEVGVDEMNGTATVTAVERSFAFNDQTGYLVPSWQFTGEFAGVDWTPNMDARRR